jgi:curli biogenesis system outer membrane secretion channel CsgG
MKTKILLFISAILFFKIEPLQAQVAEKIEKKCDGLPINQRLRIAVGSFHSTTNQSYNRFAGELATMLSNALVMTSCFQVLAGTKSNSMSDLQSEKEFNRSGDVRDDLSVEEGQMIGAQLIITGEVTEFAEGRDGYTIAGFSVTKNEAHVGFILQIASPKNRQILFSESINTEAVALGGFSGVKIFGLPSIGSFKTKAMQDAIEKAIIKAVELIVEQKDVIAISSQDSKTAIMENTTYITVENTDFGGLNSLDQLLKNNRNVKTTTKTLKNGIGTIKVVHGGDFEDLAEFFLQRTSKYKITGAEKGQITLIAKN